MSGIKYNGGTYSGSLIAVIDTDDVRHLLSVTEITAADMTLTVAGVTVGGTKTATLTVPAALNGKTVTWEMDGEAASVPDGASGLTVTVTGVSEGSATLTATVAGIEKSVTVNVTEAGGGEDDPGTGGGEEIEHGDVSVQNNGQNIYVNLSTTFILDDYGRIDITLYRDKTGGWNNQGKDNLVNYVRYEPIGGEWVCVDFNTIDSAQKPTIAAADIEGKMTLSGDGKMLTCGCPRYTNAKWAYTDSPKITVTGFAKTDEVS